MLSSYWLMLFCHSVDLSYQFFFLLNMQCFIFGLVHVQSRNELCDIGPTRVGKSFEVSGLLPVYLLCRKSIQTRFLHILS